LKSILLMHNPGPSFSIPRSNLPHNMLSAPLFRVLWRSDHGRFWPHTCNMIILRFTRTLANQSDNCKGYIERLLELALLSLCRLSSNPERGAITHLPPKVSSRETTNYTRIIWLVRLNPKAFASLTMGAMTLWILVFAECCYSWRAFSSSSLWCFLGNERCFIVWSERSPR
jgi:hypothetical protein